VGTHSVWLPSVLKLRARALAQAFAAAEPFRPRPEGLTILAVPAPSVRTLSAHGKRAVGGWAVPVEALERLADLKREAGKAELPEAALAELGWSAAETRTILTALRVPRARQPDRPNRAPPPLKDSPFAALSALALPAQRRTRKRKSVPRTG
jgi:ATP-dependent RNA helicase SUPV3L1/SUV3